MSIPRRYQWLRRPFHRKRVDVTELKLWRFYRSPRGLYAIIPGRGARVQVLRLSEDGQTTDVWSLADFLEHYNTRAMVEVTNPFEGVSRIQNWPSYGETNRGVKK
jgi:hypothetical protein